MFHNRGGISQGEAVMCWDRGGRVVNILGYYIACSVIGMLKVISISEAIIHLYSCNCSMKKILFLHGFASSGHSGTVMTLRQLLYADGVSVIAPDLPVMPQAAMTLIAQIIEEEKPDVVVTSSMGGLFGEQLRGIPRVLINPAWSMSRLLTFGGMGRREFYNKRADGAKDFKVDKEMVAEFKAIEKSTGKGVTAEDKQLVWGLFGDKDKRVNHQ